MGTGDSLPGTVAGNATNPPRFMTNNMNKQEYRHAWRIWIRMIKGFVNADLKYKAIQPGAGNLVYLACDAITQNRIR